MYNLRGVHQTIEHHHLMMACSDLHHHYQMLEPTKLLDQITILKTELHHYEGIQRGHV
jgi:hypothetical protein